MLTTKKQQQIKKLLGAKTMGEQKIADKLGTTRHQVRIVKDQLESADLLKTDQPDKVPTSLTPVSSTRVRLDAFRDRIQDWMGKESYTVFLVHKKLIDLGEDVSLSSVQRYVASLNKKEVYIPVITAAGEEAQVDYGYLGRFYREGRVVKVWVFCMVLSHSRYAFYMPVTEQTAQSFIHCHRQAFAFFGGCPGRVLIDNLGAGVLEADYYQSEFQQLYRSFLDYHGVTATNARVCRGQDKGKIEAGVKYVKQNFLPAIAHRDYDKLVTDMSVWNTEVCNRRLHGTTRRIPEAHFLKEEKQQLFSLPLEPFRITSREKRKVDPYGHVYFRYNFYSVPFHYAGEELTLDIDTKSFQVFKGEQYITTHVIHPGKGQFITKNPHKPYHKQAKTDLYYSEEMAKVGESALSIYEILQVMKPFHWKKMVSGILHLRKLFSVFALETACRQAMEEGYYDFKSVRRICVANKNRKKDPILVTVPKNTEGYHHDLSFYQRLMNKPTRKADQHD